MEKLSEYEATSLQALFDMYDTEGEAYITIAEMEDIFNKVKELDPEDVKRVMQQCDRNEDARVAFEEFARLVVLLGGKPRHVMVHAGVVEFLRILEEYRINCETERSFEEAEQATKQISALRAMEIKREKQMLNRQQINEIRDHEDYCDDKTQQFNDQWDSYLKKYDEQAQNYIAKLSDKHVEQLKKFRDKMYADLTTRTPRFSKKLLVLRNKQNRHGRLKQYVEAQRCQQIADALEEKELRSIERQRKKKFKKMEEQLRHEQHKELAALLEKINVRREEHLSRRAKDWKRLNQRGRNQRRATHVKQRLQRKSKDESVLQSLDLKLGKTTS